MPSLLQPAQKTKFLKDLFTWYKKSGRHDMPWRKSKDPYAILVSEVMLQQTTVATVKPYYERFLRRFPSLKSLAQSDLNDVLALWSGLGYYARARNLWATAQEIETRYKYKVPSDLKLLQKLPGIGAYISGAVSTIAFNRPAPVLDGNIIRVLMRVLAIEDDPKLKAVQIILNGTALEMSQQSRMLRKLDSFKKWSGPRHLSLALMDLGATVCLPRGPKCEICPVRNHCLAQKFSRQDQIPPTAETLTRPTIRRLQALVKSDGQFLLGQRPRAGLFGGLWEFPGVDCPPGEEPVPFLEQGFRNELGWEIRVKQAFSAFEHQLTHRILVIRSYLAVPQIKQRIPSLPKKSANYERFKWIGASQIQRLGISSVTKRTLAQLGTIHNDG